MSEVLILRDPRESVKKCSLTPLRGLEGVRFLEYAPDRRVQAEGRILLHHEGEEIGPGDRGLDLLLVDSNWRRLPTLLRTVEGEPIRRRLPALVTAYPRRSRITPDPDGGLASVEALWAALALTGAVRPELLEDYRFRDAFLQANPLLWEPARAAGMTWDPAARPA